MALGVRRARWLTLEPAQRDGQGTSVILHLKEEAKDYLGEWRIRGLVTRYADYVSHPIRLQVTRTEAAEEGGAVPTTSVEMEQVNEGARQRLSDLNDEDYAAFYQHHHDWEPALAHISPSRACSSRACPIPEPPFEYAL